MSDELRSILEGTIGLDIALVAAVALSLSRPLGTNPAVEMPALVTLAIQALHFSEEFLTRFPVRFPRLLGLAEWSDAFFVGFNALWIALWALAIAFAARAPRLAGVALWFLAISAIANGVAHPALSLRVGGYFPGLLTSIPLGLCGVWFARRLSGAGQCR